MSGKTRPKFIRLEASLCSWIISCLHLELLKPIIGFKIAGLKDTCICISRGRSWSCLWHLGLFHCSHQFSSIFSLRITIMGRGQVGSWLRYCLGIKIWSDRIHLGRKLCLRLFSQFTLFELWQLWKLRQKGCIKFYKGLLWKQVMILKLWKIRSSVCKQKKAVE